MMHIELDLPHPDAGAERPAVWADQVRDGDGLELRHGWLQTQFGDAFALASGAGLAGLGFAGERGRNAVEGYFRRRWPKARWTEDADAVAGEVGGADEARLHLMGTPFQRRVWKALLSIPPGETSSYAGVAAAIGGGPGSGRAVGGAVAANPVSWFVPCHRVIGASGAATGYLWGLPLKRSMLAWEAGRRMRAAA